MNTINISLTKEQTEFIDTSVVNLGFASRSEFIRTLLRVVIRNPKVVTLEENKLFSAPPAVSKNIVLREFSKSNKYSKKFLKDLETGIKESNYFK